MATLCEDDRWLVREWLLEQQLTPVKKNVSVSSVRAADTAGTKLTAIAHAVRIALLPPLYSNGLGWDGY